MVDTFRRYTIKFISKMYTRWPSGTRLLLVLVLGLLRQEDGDFKASLAFLEVSLGYIVSAHSSALSLSQGFFKTRYSFQSSYSPKRSERTGPRGHALPGSSLQVPRVCRLVYSTVRVVFLLFVSHSINSKITNYSGNVRHTSPCL